MKLWTNGVFHTMRHQHDVHHQMATHQGKIIAFDEDAESMTYDEIIDLKGAHVYPGFVDAHLHLLGYGQMLSRIPLFGLSKAQVLDVLKKSYAHAMIYAEGYMDSGITKHDLNQISCSHPIYIRHNDYHSLTVNDVVLKLMRHTSESGILTEDIAEKAMNVLPKHTKVELKRFLEQALKKLYQFGITGGHSDDLYYFNGFHDTVEVFEEVLKDMPFRAHLLIHHKTLDGFVSSGRTWHRQSERLELGAVKMFYDGTISSKTAWMHAPYRGSDHHGMRIHAISDFIRMVQEARKHGLTVAVHVIGDRGLDELLEILKANPPKEGQLDRLIHTPYLRHQTLDAIRGMPLSIDIQPQFLSSDLPWALDRFSIAPELLFPWKSLMEAGVILSGSSDAPVEIPNPLLGMHAAIFRRYSHDLKAYAIEEAIRPYEAIWLYTTGAQIQSMDDHRGVLKVGAIADLTVTYTDLETLPEDAFFKPQIKMTVVDETIVYDDTHMS